MASRDLYSNVSISTSIGAQAVAAAVNGTGVSMNQHESAVVVLDLGTFGGTTPSATIQIQESDDDSTYSAVAAGDLHGGALPSSIDTTNDAQVYKRGYIGSKPYIRVAVTAVSGTAPSLPMSAVIVRGHPSRPPV